MEYQQDPSERPLLVPEGDSCLPHLLMTVFLECRLFVTLLLLDPFLLLFFGLGRQHKLLRYLLLGDELGDGTRLPASDRKGRRERGGGRLMGGKIGVNIWLHASLAQ